MNESPNHPAPAFVPRLRRCGTVRSRLARLVLASATAAAAVAQPTTSTAMDLATPLACPSAAARPVQVCFALDASASIQSQNFSDMKNSVAKAVSAASTVPQDGSVSLSFVLFSDSAQVAVPMTKISSQAIADQVSTMVRSLPYLAGNTATGDAIAICAQQFSMAPGQRHVINVITDSDDSGYRGRDLRTARNYAVDKGVNVINGLGIGSGDTVLQGLKRFVWPAPASVYPADGFAALITDWAFVPEGIAGMMSASTFTISSSNPAAALPVSGTLSEQLTKLNGP